MTTASSPDGPALHLDHTSPPVATSVAGETKKKKRKHNETVLTDEHTNVQAEMPKSKKKKKAHSAVQADSEQLQNTTSIINHTPINPEEDAEAKKKRRNEKKLARKAAKAIAAASHNHSQAPHSTNTTSGASTVDPPRAGELHVKKKKKKAEKPGSSSVNLSPVITTVDDHVYTTAPALLSALFSATNDGPLDPDLQQQLSQLASSNGAGLPDLLNNSQQPATQLGSGSTPFMVSGHQNAMDTSNPVVTNEELVSMLQTIQDLDVNKVAGVLRTLGTVATYEPSAPTVATEPPRTAIPIAIPSAERRSTRGIPTTIPRAPSNYERRVVHEAPRASAGIMNQPVGATGGLGSASTTEAHEISDRHLALLAEKWLSTADLNRLAKEEGLVHKKGKFSKIEDLQLEQAMESYMRRNGKTKEDVLSLVDSEGKNAKKDVTFWHDMATAVPGRPLTAVYHHVKRMLHPMSRMGKWQSDEDARLRQTVLELGPVWERVSEVVGRRSVDCRDRWRNHLAEEGRNTGPWSKEEEEELVRVVAEVKASAHNSEDGDIFWSQVSKKMGGKRGRQQCQGKWSDALEKRIKSGGISPRWTTHDNYILIHKVDSLKVRHDTEIKWSAFPDSNWNLWSPHIIQQKWTALKKNVQGWETMTLPDILEVLKAKHGEPSTLSKASQNVQRRVKSSRVVNADLDGEDEVDRAVNVSEAVPGHLSEVDAGREIGAGPSDLSKGSKKKKKNKNKGVTSVRTDDLAAPR